MAFTSNWLESPVQWEGRCRDLLLASRTENTKGKKFHLDDLIKRSDKFPIAFPIDTVRCSHLQFHYDLSKPELEHYIKSAYPLIHENALLLCAKFLLHKCEHGSEVEKLLYKNMSLLNFIDRLLLKRSVVFVCEYDLYLLRDATIGRGNWETIGTESEESPLLLENYLSYDEIKISALLSVSSYSFLINDGNRYNNGALAPDRTNLQHEAVVIGLVGPRLEKRNVMEFQEMIVNPSANSEKLKKKSVLSVFFDIYEETRPIYSNTIKEGDYNGRFIYINDSSVYLDIFDNLLYAKRLSLSFDTLLFEANKRASKSKKQAYIHVVGLGLGMWKISKHQYEVFFNVFHERLSIHRSKLLSISDVHFSHFKNLNDCSKYKDKQVIRISGHSQGGIKIHLSDRLPHSKLQDPNKLLIVSYAWDGNALPGNDFWQGALSSSGDSAQAASSQIAELHNPHINEYVCSKYLKIATVGGNLLSLNKYIDQINQE